MSRGVFGVDRGLWEHPLFRKEPFTEREAWIWMLSRTCWRSHRTRPVGTARPIELRRGEFALSLRFLAHAWSWKEPRVRRFLNRLKRDAMIDARSDAGVTVVTICNFDKYQTVALPRDATTDAGGYALAAHLRRKEEERVEREEREIEEDTPSNPEFSERPPYAIDTGTKVRLRQKQIDDWVKAFPDVNVEAEIWSAHTWAAGQKNWFQALAGKLAKLQREATSRPPATAAGHPEAAYDASF